MTKSTPRFEQYFSSRYACGTSFSPDSKTIAFLTDITDVPEVWSIPLDIQAGGSSWPEQLTFRGERVVSATFSPTAPLLLVTGDSGGSERTQLFLLSDDGAMFEAITTQPEAIYQFGWWSPDGTRITYASNERKSSFFDVYERVLATGETHLLLLQDGTHYPRGYSPDGRHVLVERSESNTRNTLFLLETTTGNLRCLTPAIDEGVALHLEPAWTADRQGLYLLSNRGRQFVSLARLDLVTADLVYLRDERWDAEHLAVTKDGTRLALVTNEAGYSRVELFEVSQGWEARDMLPAPTLPPGVIADLTWSSDGRYLALTLIAAADVCDIWIWDTKACMLWRATRSSRGGVPRDSFVVPKLVHYPTFDKRQIPAFLYLPQGQPPGQLPFVIDVHGGPELQARPLLDPFFQYLLASGYGVLAPNVRGSTGYGSEYQSLDDRQLRMNAVSDLQHAALWLRDSGLADGARISVIGGSYGGFMVLAALTMYPDLWAAGIDLWGVANFVTFLEQTGPWRRKEREAEYGSLEHDRTFLEQLSPIHHVDRIAAPLFVVHGANDPRVPVGEAEQIVNALRARGMPVEYMLFGDEGHGLIKRANVLAAYLAITQFLETHVRQPK